MRKKIRALVKDALKGVGDEECFADAETLITNGRMSSLAVVQLAVSLEEAFELSFAEGSFDVDQLESVDAIVEWIDKRKT